MTLVEFLITRIAEDEAAACDQWNLAPHSVNCGVRLGYWAETDCVCGYPVRFLAECEAKRRIVRDAEDAEAAAEPYPTFNTGMAAAYEDVLKVLALSYADHPDYRDDWRP